MAACHANPSFLMRVILWYTLVWISFFPRRFSPKIKPQERRNSSDVFVLQPPSITAAAHAYCRRARWSGPPLLADWLAFLRAHRACAGLALFPLRVAFFIKWPKAKSLPFEKMKWADSNICGVVLGAKNDGAIRLIISRFVRAVQMLKDSDFSKIPHFYMHSDRNS